VFEGRRCRDCAWYAGWSILASYHPSSGRALKPHPIWKYLDAKDSRVALEVHRRRVGVIGGELVDMSLDGLSECLRPVHPQCGSLLEQEHAVAAFGFLHVRGRHGDRDPALAERFQHTPELAPGQRVHTK